MAGEKIREPIASRPEMPGYGIVEANAGKGLLPWSWAVERLSNSHNYFLSTTRPNGRPHCMPVWAVWIDEGLCFSTGVTSVKARNLAANPRCVVTTENADHAVILEGVARTIEQPEFVRAGELYAVKYPPYKLDPNLGPIFVVEPRIVFGMIENEMVDTATRWVFK
jgi:hypothetical protein